MGTKFETIVLEYSKINKVTYLDTPEGVLNAIIVHEENADIIYDIDYFKNELFISINNIMIWGKEADIIENFIDEILEETGFLEIVTSAHVDENSDDMADYLISCSLIDRDFASCVLIFQPESKKVAELINSLGMISKIKVRPL